MCLCNESSWKFYQLKHWGQLYCQCERPLLTYKENYILTLHLKIQNLKTLTLEEWEF